MYSALKTPDQITPPFWEQFTRQVAEAFTEKHGGTLVDPYKHSDFLVSFANLAKRAGLWTPSGDCSKPYNPKTEGYIPHVIVMDEFPMGPVWTRKLPQGGANPMRMVLLNDSMMKLTGSSIYGKMSSELETVMAHEFSHLKDGGFHLLGNRLQVFAMPLVAMAGLYLYDRAKEKTEHKQGQSKAEYLNELTGNIHKEADAEIAKAHNPEKPNEWHIDPDWHECIMNAGRYFLVAAVGLCAGLGIARHVALSAEYRADKMAVELTGNPEIFKKVLSDLHATRREARPEKPIADTFGKIIKEKYHDLLGETIHAHPTLKQRISYIDGLEQNAGFSAARA